MEIVITGAAGFIGFHLCQRLLKEGKDVIGIDNMNNYYDVSLKHARLEELFKSSKIYKSKFKSKQLSDPIDQLTSPRSISHAALAVRAYCTLYCCASFTGIILLHFAIFFFREIDIVHGGSLGSTTKKQNHIAHHHPCLTYIFRI